MHVAFTATHFLPAPASKKSNFVPTSGRRRAAGMSANVLRLVVSLSGSTLAAGVRVEACRRTGTIDRSSCAAH